MRLTEDVVLEDRDGAGVGLPVRLRSCVAYGIAGTVAWFLGLGAMVLRGGGGGLPRAVIAASADQRSHHGEQRCANDQQRRCGEESLSAQLAATVLAAENALSPLTSLNPFV